MKTVLITPVGDTDPVRNDFDGPMLHILRHNPCDEAYVLYTQKMWQKEQEDQRFTRTIQWIQPQCKIIPIQTGIEDAHDFNTFGQWVQKTFNEISQRQERLNILVNITSGTPQMMATLCLGSVIQNQSLKTIQVTSPQKGSNAGTPHAMDFDEGMLENSLDNLDEAEIRLIDADILLFKRTLLIGRIKSLIKRYDYGRAIEEKNSDSRIVWPEPLENQLEVAWLRMSLKTNKAKAKAQKYGLEWQFLNNAKASLVMEYFLAASARRKVGDLWEFVMRLSPLLVNLAECYLEQAFGFEVSRVVTRSRRGVRKFDTNKMITYCPAVKIYLESEWGAPLRLDYVKTHVLLEIMRALKTNSTKPTEEIENYIATLEKLREVEEVIRNTLAHELVYIDDIEFEKKAQMTSQQVEEKLKTLIFNTFRPYLKKGIYEVYENLNHDILIALEQLAD